MSRKHWLMIVLFVAPILGAWLTAQLAAISTARADQIALPASTAGVEIAGLQDQLEKGLKARFPHEFEFIAVVVARVENETLPYRLVYISFKYARNKHPKYPFVYFERSLKELAEKEGIDI